MKPLPTSFRKDGWERLQIHRDGDIAVFEQFKPGYDTVRFEVVLVQSHNGYEIAGNKIEPAECMPPTESWGVKGWTFMDRDAALQKVDELMFR